MRKVVRITVGDLFGTGLILSGMTDTAKAQGFLEIIGDWDVTLAFVMGGATLPKTLAWRWTVGCRPVMVGQLPMQPDTRLIAVSVLFGMGWALVRLCLGLAMAGMFWGGLGGIVFVAAMIAGIIAAPAFAKRLDAGRTAR
jgi:hypothetical protein